ncbi:hypothetical protein BJX61DRAFT_542068 [Aspergillus egyptiacus]|nr:hypothetical protein BJX61DRAFT_542068 [Aspergillus egyptiacus]
MEVPSVDDTMEMASPYPGHADDFEIDIDVMEDRASNADRDMIADDDYMDNSHGANYDPDGLPDEDMIDDAAEPSMVDADDYTETNQNIEMQYEEERTYEAEMLEDDYDEVIDVPVTEYGQETLAPHDQADKQETRRASPTMNDKDLHDDTEHTPVESRPETGAETLDKSQSALQPDSHQTEQAEQAEQPVGYVDVKQQADKQAEETEPASADPGHTEETSSSTNQAEVDTKQVLNDSAGDTEVTQTLEIENEDPNNSNQTQAPLQETEKPESEIHEENPISGSDDQEPEPAAEKEEADQTAGQEHEPAESVPLHPIKVYYQDNEISLFPPREGDSSETFFLEDESLAYGPLGKLLKSCREVLQDHINKNEVLVLDIDALNLQITEDSLELNNVTLKLIVDVYLQLCHNDGLEEPEALYLTLSTKLTIAAEMSDLLLAASEGKGLSDIQPWEVYPETEGASAVFRETAEETYPEEPQDNSNEGKLAGSREHAVQPTSHEDAVSGHQQDDPEQVENQTNEDGGANLDDTEAETRNVSWDNGSPQAASHDSEEQKTDSTGTLEFLPVTDEQERHPGQDEVAGDSYGDGNDEEYHEEAEADEEAYPEEESYVDDLGPNDGSEETEGKEAPELTEGHSEEHHDLELEPRDQPGPEEAAADDTSQNDTDAISDKEQPQDLPETTEPLNGPSPNLQPHQDQPLVDDTPGSTGDVLESLGNDSTAVDELAEAGDASEPGEIDENVEHLSPSLANNEDAADLPSDDDEDYLDFGITEDFGDVDQNCDVTSPSRVSTKRSREADDDLDLPESTTPEVKRSRSS